MTGMTPPEYEVERLRVQLDATQAGVRHAQAERDAFRPLAEAAQAWREARIAFGSTRREPEHDVLWAATDRLEAAVDALAGEVGTADAPVPAGLTGDTDGETSTVDRQRAERWLDAREAAGFCTQCGAQLAGEHFDSCPRGATS